MLNVTWDGLLGRGAQLLERARATEFLWEVVLAPEEAGELREHLARFRLRIGEDRRSRFALAVFAVNYAYERDDESAKFIEPFTELLLRRPDPRAWWSDLGPAIEQAVLEWCGRRRPNGLRFVGLVYEQVGVPRRRLRPFAQLLVHIDDLVGWGAVPRSSDRALSRVTAERIGTSSYFSQFLQTESGCDLLRAVCGDLALYRDGDLGRDELRALKGYRPGLMDELLEQLAIDPPLPVTPARGSSVENDLRDEDADDERLLRTRDPADVPQERQALPIGPPRLMLNSWYRRVYLGVSPADLDGFRMTCDQYPGGTFTQPTLVLGRHLPFAPAYSGTRGAERWEAPGWLPTATGWLLFDSTGALVGTSDGVGPPAPGAYKLLVADSVPVAADAGAGAWLEGTADLPGVPHPFRLYSIRLTPGSRVTPLPRTLEEAGPQPEAVAVGAAPWSDWTGVGAVFAGTVPRFLIRGWNADAAQRYVVFLNSEDGPVRVRPDPEDGFLELEQVAEGVVSTLTLRPVGRARTARPVAEFRFVRWPACHIEADARVMGPNDVAAVHIRAPAKSPLSVRGALATGENRWRAETATGELITFELGFAGRELAVSVPVPRVRLRRAGLAEGPLILEPQDLRNGAPPLEIASPAGRPLRLLLRDAFALDDAPPTVVAELPPPATSAEWRSVAPEALRAASHAGLVAGRLEADDGRTSASTDAWLIDVPRLLTAMPPRPASLLPDCVARGFALIASIGAGGAGARDIDPLEVRPESLRREAARWAAAADAVRGTSPMEALSLLIAPQARHALGEVADVVRAAHLTERAADPPAAAEAVGRTWDALGPERLMAEQFPAATAWPAELAALRETLRRRADVGPRLGLWLESCVADAGGSEVPEALRMAGHDYLCAHLAADGRREAEFLKGSVRRFRQVLEGNTVTEQVWREVSAVLAAMACLRLGQVGEFCRRTEGLGECRYTAQAASILRWMHGVIRLQGQPAGTVTLTLPPSYGLRQISPRPDDHLIEAAARGGEREWFAAAGGCWIGAWLCWRASCSAGGSSVVRKRLRSAATECQERIPECLDKCRIQEELEADSATAWT